MRVIGEKNPLPALNLRPATDPAEPTETNSAEIPIVASVDLSSTVKRDFIGEGEKAKRAPWLVVAALCVAFCAAALISWVAIPALMTPPAMSADDTAKAFATALTYQQKPANAITDLPKDASGLFAVDVTDTTSDTLPAGLKAAAAWAYNLAPDARDAIEVEDVTPDDEDPYATRHILISAPAATGDATSKITLVLDKDTEHDRWLVSDSIGAETDAESAEDASQAPEPADAQKTPDKAQKAS